MIIAFLLALTIVFLGVSIFYIKKYNKLKKSINKYEEIGTNRSGFYINNKGGNDAAIVYIDELDRYTTGYSKVKIKSVESLNPNYKEDSISYAYKKFVSLMETSDIIWLESEDNIKKIRKEKLEQIKKL